MTTTSPNDQHQQLNQIEYDMNSEQHTFVSKQWKQQEHDEFYTMKKQSVAAVLSPLSSNASSPPTEPFLQLTDNTQPLSLPTLPKAIQTSNTEGIPSPPPSALTKGMDSNSPDSQKQKSPSPYAFEHTGSTTTTTTTNMTRDQIRYCSALIRNLKKHRDATPFIHPVDYVKLNLPDYPRIIKTPMDLTTIDLKFHHKQYIDVDQFINDIRLLFNNCYKYNGPEAIVSMLCQNVESAFEKGLWQMPLSKKVSDPSLASNSHDTRNESSSSSLQGISPVFRRRSDAIRSTPTHKDDTNTITTNTKSPTQSFQKQQRGRRRSHVDDNDNGLNKRRKIDTRLKFCGQAIRELKKNKYQTINYPFLYPVDTVALNIPDYHTIVSHPMDISTIERNLAKGEYGSAEQVESDVRLMFNNCYRYNHSALPVHKMAKKLEMVFDEKWKQLPTREPTPPPPPPSAVTTTNKRNHLTFHDNDDSDDDVSDGGDQIAQLERRVASIAQQIESIKSTKKKSSSASTVGTKRKTPNTKKRTRRPSSTAKEKSTPKRASTTTRHRTSSTTELPEFTFDQKKGLSESINNLTGDRLNTVVNIIQSSMPNLNGHGQDEIVLDIDVLDRETLHQLYEFIMGKSLLRKQHQHQYKKRKTITNNQRLRALEESLRQINARSDASSDSGSSGSESEDDFGSE